MGLGVLEDRKLQHVPGTAALEDLDDPNADVQAQRAEHGGRPLKLSKDGTVLVPQPSDSPDDPLNWPLWQRDIITGILCLSSVIASTLSPLLAANTLYLTIYFESTFTKMALLTGYHLLGVAVGGFIFVPSARVWGKRHLYIIGNVIIIFSSAWGGASNHSYNSLLAARFFQGIGLAPFEGLVNASVGDLYCVHERGKRMAATNLCLFGGAFFTPVIVGKMTSTLGWQWTFYFIAIFAGALLPLIIFLVPETAYRRETDAEDDVTRTEVNAQYSKETGETSHSASQSSKDLSEEYIQPTFPTPKLISRYRMRVFNGRKTDESYIKLLIRPLPLFLQPAILWACLIQGTLIGWTVLMGIVLAAVMFEPPLGFTEVKVGYMYTGAFIGAIVGFSLAGVLSDRGPRWMARRNGGVFEPEFRLPWLVLPQLVLGSAGLYGFGIVCADIYRYRWFWPDFFFSLEVAGMVLGAVASALYIVDAHSDIAIEGFTCLLVFKNVFSFGLTFSGFTWLETSSIKTVFLVVGSVQIGICATTLVLYVFGKRNRSFFYRHDILALLRLR